ALGYTRFSQDRGGQWRPLQRGSVPVVTTAALTFREVCPPMRPELDSCGIGFVADARGRTSRAIVEAALQGLACVKHRGAPAADALTADGSGVLVPIPVQLFGDGRGLAMLFVNGPDPRPEVESAAAAEGIEIVEWREPPTDDAQLGHQAKEYRPRIVQAVLEMRDGGSHDERAAFRL